MTRRTNKEKPMSQHVTISPTESADRLAIRELIEAYAHCADRRDAKGQTSLLRQTPISWFSAADVVVRGWNGPALHREANPRLLWKPLTI
jgi:hypothetical protein